MNRVAVLYFVAVGPYVLLLGLAAAHSLIAPDEYGSVRYFVWLAFGFYGLALLFSRRLLHSGGRRRWMRGLALGSLVIAFLGGGPAGFILFGPSVALLVWLSLRS